MRYSKSVLFALVGVLVWNGVAAAQCMGPDGLDGGPCCAQATLNLPNFPNFNQKAIEICWKDCNVSSVVPYTAHWKNVLIKPGTVGGSTLPCGEFTMTLDLLAGTAVQWTGTFLFQYSRTWEETDPSGGTLQVWRFLINGDLRTVGPIGLPCPVPVCAPANGNRVHFSGYMDEAGICGTILFQRAWMITHACDSFHHVAGFPRAGVFHPDRSYSIVGPSLGFVPGPLQPTEGTPGSPFEAMRRSVLGAPAPAPPTICTFEERINFQLLPQNQFCMCGLPGTQQFLLANLDVLGACGSSVNTPGGPLLPGFLSMGIGSWTIAGTFPGVEAVRWNAGQYNWFDSCTGALQSEVFFGATTIGGYAAKQIVAPPQVPAPLPMTFIDQSNSLRPPLGVGTVMNVPYISDHFLNLNH